MSKAAKHRLTLLRDQESLPLPLDDALLRPFGVRFINMQMVLTYGQQDVAIVPREAAADERSFDLIVLIKNSDTVDRAIRSVFVNLTHYLDGVGKYIAQEKRKEKVRLDALKRERIADQEKTLREAIAYVETFVSDTPDPLAHSVSLEDFKDSLITDRSLVGHTHMSSHRPLRGGIQQGCLVFKNLNNLSVVFELRQGHIYPSTFVRQGRIDSHLIDHVNRIEKMHLDTRRVCDEIEGLAEISRDLLNPQRVTDMLDALPASRYEPNVWLLDRPLTMNAGMIKCGEDTTLIGGFDFMQIKRKGHTVLSINLRHFAKTFPEMKAYVTRYRYQPENEIAITALNDAQMERLVCLWIEAMAATNPDLDFSVYEKPDVEALIRDADLTDHGYVL